MKSSSQYDRYEPRQPPHELNNISHHNKASNYETSSKRDILINWVNSIEYPNCLLASDISDFRDGIIFCELVNEVVLNNRKPDFLTQVKNNNLTYQDTLYNINMALNEIRSYNHPKILPEIKNLKAHELISDEDKAVFFLECLYNIVQSGEARLPTQNYENSSYNPFEKRPQSDIEKLVQNQPMIQFQKSDPVSTNSSQISPSVQASMNKTIQRPPRNSATPPNRSRIIENTQPAYTRGDASPYKEHGQGNTGSNNIYQKQSSNSFKSNSVYTPLSQNNPQNHSPLNYDPLNQSQQQQAVHENSAFISKEAINKNESSSIYSNMAQSHVMNYSDIIQNNSYINDETSKSARRTDYVKPENNTNQKPFQSSATPIQNKRLSHTPIQSTNPTGMYTNETQYTPAVTESRSKSPDLGQGERYSTKSKKSAVSITPQKLTPHDERKLSASAIKQRINQLKDQKEKKEPSPIPRSRSNQRLSPYKKTETLSSIKHTEPDRKIVWEDSKKNEKVVITPVTEELKIKMMNWLYSITLIKENLPGIEKKLPKICRDGVIFIDLLNRLEGKHEIIKGVNRKPETKTHIHANYQRLTNFLGRFEKMNPRYLWAQDYLIQGNDDVFWGFLDDIWHLYNKKVSPYDPRFNRDDKRATLKFQASTMSAFKESQRSKRSHLEVSYNDICYHDKSKLNNSYLNTTSPVHTKSRSRSRSPSEHDFYENKLNHSFKSKKNDVPSQIQMDNSFGNYESNGRESKYDQGQANGGYQNRYAKKSNMVRSPSQGRFKSIIKKGDASKFFSRSFTDSEYDDTSNLGLANGISIEGENQVFEWLKSLGFKAMLMRDRSSLFEDPFRNGTLLCYVLGRIENERMHSIYKDPKSIDECRHNVYQAFQVIVRKQTPIPTYLKGKEEAVLKGDRNILLSLLYALMKITENRAGLNTSVMTNTDKMYKQETSYIPPYDDREMEQLEHSLINWLDSFGLFQGLPAKPPSMKELAIHFRNGVMLCDLTAIVTNSKLLTIHRRPTSELQCMTNIRKALEVLRGKKMMAQRYLWKERDIYTGNKYILLGLLEDLHRFFDGLPPRSNPNYFLEGPYIPKRDELLEKPIREQRPHFGRSEGGIQPRTSNRIQSPTRGYSLVASSYNSRRASREGENKFQDTNRSKLREYQNAKLNLSSDEPISIIDYEKKAKGSPVKQHMEGYMSSNLSRWESYHENGIYKSPKSDMKKMVQLEFPLNSAKFSDITSYKSVPKSMLGEDKSVLNSDEYRQYRSVLSNSKDADLKEWIVSLGFGPQVKELNIEANILEEFKDGILLCKIIEALELQAIPGVILKPRTNASKVVNIRKCLNTLSKKPGVNPHLLHIEDKILAGDGESIRKLLASIREAYRFMNKCLQRTQSPSTSRYIDESIRGIRSERNSGDRWNLYFPQENYVLNSQERKVAIIPPKFAKD